MIIHTNTKVIIDFDIVHMYSDIYFFEHYKKSGFGFLVNFSQLNVRKDMVSVALLVNGVYIVSLFHKDYCKIVPVYNLDTLSVFERLELFVDGFIID